MHFVSCFSRAQALILLIAGLTAAAQQPLQLPAPQTTGGKPLMQALAERRTTRVFRDEGLSPRTLSNLLWAAFGVNRPRDVKLGLGRTAPSAMNKQEVEIYVVLAKGVYLYDAETNELKPKMDGDVRAKVGSGDAAHAAATIVYVAPASNDFAQVAPPPLPLPDGRRPLYAQSVGYPPE